MLRELREGIVDPMEGDVAASQTVEVEPTLAVQVSR